jgi:hypothetical protein
MSEDGRGSRQRRLGSQHYLACEFDHLGTKKPGVFRSDKALTAEPLGRQNAEVDRAFNRSTAEADVNCGVARTHPRTRRAGKLFGHFAGFQLREVEQNRPVMRPLSETHGLAFVVSVRPVKVVWHSRSRATVEAAIAVRSVRSQTSEQALDFLR